MIHYFRHLEKALPRKNFTHTLSATLGRRDEFLLLWKPLVKREPQKSETHAKLNNVCKYTSRHIYPLTIPLYKTVFVIYLYVPFLCTFSVSFCRSISFIHTHTRDETVRVYPKEHTNLYIKKKIKNIKKRKTHKK